MNIDNIIKLLNNIGFIQHNSVYKPDMFKIFKLKNYTVYVYEHSKISYDVKLDGKSNLRINVNLDNFVFFLYMEFKSIIRQNKKAK